VLRVSIVTAVLNGGSSVEYAINSVLGQTYPEIEYIIVDGGSTDGTLEIIRKYEHRISRWICEADEGFYDALNKGLKMATGEVIGILNSDDIFANERVLETVVRTFAETGVDSCYGDLQYVSKADTSKIIRHWCSGAFTPGLLRQGWMPPHSTFFAKKDVYDKYGYFNLGYKISADYELMMRVLGKYEISTAYIPEVLVKMRVGGVSNRSLSNILRKSSEDYRIIRRHNLGGLTTLIMKNLSKLPQFIIKKG